MNKRASGFTLIELLITLAVMALLFMLGLPSMNTWLQNQQLRTSAEGIQAGLQLARAESLRRNVPVRFQFVDTLTSACVPFDKATNWIVSVNDPTGKCNVAESDPSAEITDPTALIMIQKRSGAEGSPNAAVVAVNGLVAANTVTFSGLGRAIGVAPITQIDIKNPSGGVCQPAGPMRCLRINIASGGQMRMCDPIVVDATDPRKCQ
ncbi:MAG TPA: GspH/FimT family pseudopilin [Burkholderiales bacterium]|jgi:type IV fimbrial biogenesis protein FimT|nr:GspH/FimT family pseudopilin [Burkholderiales bacterium]